MATTPEEVDVDRLVADPGAMDELNQSVIKEFRANQGRSAVLWKACPSSC